MATRSLRIPTLRKMADTQASRPTILTMFSWIYHFFSPLMPTFASPPPPTPQSSGATINLNTFSETQVLEHPFPRIVFIGKSNSGKTEAVKTLCHNAFRKACAHTFIQSSHCSEFYKGFNPKTSVGSAANLMELENVYNAQKAKKAHWDEIAKAGHMTEEDAQRQCHLLLILDDLQCLGEHIFKNDLIKDIWMNGHRSCISVIITLQYASGVGPMLRDHSDWVFTWQESSITGQKKLYTDWIGYFDSFADFKTTFNAVTGRDRCMVTRKTPLGRNDVESNVFVWSPTPIEDDDFIMPPAFITCPGKTLHEAG